MSSLSGWCSGPTRAILPHGDCPWKKLDCPCSCHEKARQKDKKLERLLDELI